MLIVKKKGNLYITFQTDYQDAGFIDTIKGHFTDYVENYQFTGRFKSGWWDGRISMYNGITRTLPYGLLLDLVRFRKEEYPHIEMKVEKDVLEMFQNPFPYEINWDLKFFPRDYQRESIEIALKHSKGIIRSATASGKSLIIAYIVKTLLESNATRHNLIIVPTISLVEQFKSDLIEYGMNKSIIGQVYEAKKEFGMPIVISTWQSLSIHSGVLKNYDCVICDEVHQAKAYEIKKIMEKCVNAGYRFGFTGTLPSSKMDMWNIKAFIGPVWKEYTASELAEKGYISKCNIVAIDVKYQEEYEGEYNELKDKIFNNQFRMKLLRHLVASVDKNILLLVGKVEKEGQLLKDYLQQAGFKDREIVFIWGETNAAEREKWRKECEKRKNIILIATYGVFQMGVNIPSLKYIILASPFKSKIRVLQSIGRALRTHSDKVNGAVVVDVVDDCKYLQDHGIKRSRYYSSEGFNVADAVIEEGDDIESFIPTLPQFSS